MECIFEVEWESSILDMQVMTVIMKLIYNVRRHSSWQTHCYGLTSVAVCTKHSNHMTLFYINKSFTV